MYDVLVEPSSLEGALSVPPSKSLMHRALLAASLAEGESCIRPVHKSRDIEATLRALDAFGSTLREADDSFIVNGSGLPKGVRFPIDVGDSASTLRFCIPLSMLDGEKSSFIVDDTLGRRPMTTYENLFPGALRFEDNRWFVSPALKPGRFHLKGDISSQFASGLLFALPLLDEPSILTIDRPASWSYIRLTLDVLKLFGIDVLEQQDGFRIPGGQRFTPQTYRVESDFSHAAMLLVCGIRNPRISVENLSADSHQADGRIIDILKKTNTKIVHTETGYATNHADIEGFTADVDSCPDLTPALALLGAFASGRTQLTGIHRLKYKESDRSRTIVETLKTLGADIRLHEERIVIEGDGKPLGGGVSIDSQDDHRIAMMAACAAVTAHRPVRINHAETVEKSYPAFFQDLERLGATLTFFRRDVPCG